MNRHLPIEQNMEVCVKCPLNEGNHIRTPCLTGTYSRPELHTNDKQCDIMVVVESPEKEDEAITASGIPKDEITVYNNNAGEMLRISLDKIEVEDYYITYIVKCRCASPRGDRNIPPTPKIIKACKSYFQQELEMVQPKYVLLLGNSAMSGAIGKSGLKKCHGTPFQIGDATYVATYNVTALRHNAKYRYPYKDDINLFQRVIKAGGNLVSLREPVFYEYADTMPRVQQMFAELIKAGFFVFDLETPSVNPWKKTPHFKDPPAVGCIAFSTRPNTAWVLPIDHPDSPFTPEQKDKILSVLKAVMENHEITKGAHNCLQANTWVLMGDGSKQKISYLVNNKITDPVLCYNTKTQHVESKPITGWFKDRDKNVKWVKILTSGCIDSYYGVQSHRMTHDHKVFIKGKGMVPAYMVNTSDKLLTSVPDITSIQRQVIIGSLLGDASLSLDKTHKAKNAYFKVSHCSDQLDYLVWKSKILSNIVKNGVKDFSNNRGFSSHKGSDYRIHNFTTRALPCLTFLYDKFYNDKKEVSSYILSELTPFSIAVWYMVDGSKSKNGCRLHTSGYSDKSIQLIIDYFIDNYGITFKRVKRNKGFDLRIHSIEDGYKFFSIIKPYIIPNMQYKIPDRYIDNIVGSEIDRLLPEFKNWSFVEVIDVVDAPMTMKSGSKYTRFCIEVANNHNFFTTVGLVSNSKFDVKYLKVVKNIDTNGLVCDTMLESYLLNEEQGQHSLKDLALRFTDLGDYEAKLEKKRKEMVKLGPNRGGLPKSEEYNYMRYPMNDIFPYAACDADATMRLKILFEPELEKQDLIRVRDEILLKINETLGRMEYNGAKLDVPYAKQKTIEFEQKVKEQEVLMKGYPEIKYLEEYYQLRAAIHSVITYKKKYIDAKEALIAYCQKTFNQSVEDFLVKVNKKPLKDRLTLLKSLRLFDEFLEEEQIEELKKKEKFKFNSIFHMQHLIYDYLGEKVFKKTDSKQPAVDEEVLTTYAPKHAILTEIVKYKKLTKFLSTYIAPSTEAWLCDDGYIHTMYSLHGTVTGRLSSKQPNMQNLPRDDKTVKSMIISRFEGGKILNVDYSQLELRVLAVNSKDKGLIDAYNAGKDLHTNTAAIILNKPFDEVSKDERQIFKAINFLIVYGGTAMALATKVNIDESVAQQFMDDYFKMFPGVTEYKNYYQDYARKHKQIRCLTGRIRRLYDVDSDKEYVREEALRMAINTPIQSTASDITQISLYNLQKVFDRVGIKSLLIGTVHDSAFIDLYPGELQQVCTIIETVFENPSFDFLKENGQYIVPFKCDIEVGDNYGSQTAVVKEGGVWSIKSEK